MTPHDTKAFHIGSRVCLNEDFATVKFVGHLEGTQGEWLGVEWDSSARGKHNGEHKGKAIFQVTQPGRGSFIRPVPKLLNGKTIVEAIRGKYIDALDQTEDDIVKLKWGDEASKEIVAVGWDKLRLKQGRLDRLTIVGLDDEQIRQAGEQDELRRACPAIQDLDLSRNLICGWDMLVTICQQLDHLDILRANHNRFHISLEREDVATAAFFSVKTLAINHCALMWDEINTITSNFINLQILQCSHNLCGVSMKPPQYLSQLRVLNLEGNGIATWDLINSLSSLPHLAELGLKSNEISLIQYNGGFEKLEYMELSNNLIKEWTSIDQLNLFPALKNLRILNNPFQADSMSESNLIVIARIKTLEKLNSQEIHLRERTDTELYYLSSIMKTTENQEEASRLHPRFEELFKKHGEPEFVSTKGQDTRNVLKKSLLKIKLSSKTSLSDSEAIKSIEKKFPASMTVRNLKNIVQRLFSIPAIQQKLTIISKTDGATVHIEMDNDVREVTYYELRDGDEIIILSV